MLPTIVSISCDYRYIHPLKPFLYFLCFSLFIHFDYLRLHKIVLNILNGTMYFLTMVSFYHYFSNTDNQSFLVPLLSVTERYFEHRAK